MRSRRRSLRSVLAFTLSEVMAVSAIIATVQTGAYVQARNRALQTQCVSNLQQIGKVIMMYQTTMDAYPEAAFYPSDPLKSANSIVTVIENAGYSVPREMWACPGLPEKLQARGLTFIYNDRLNAGRGKPEDTWVLIEFNSVSDKVPAPHPGGYNVLLASGRVVTTPDVGRYLDLKQKAALDEVRCLLAAAGRD